jgi:hypothetical protein
MHSKKIKFGFLAVLVLLAFSLNLRVVAGEGDTAKPKAVKRKTPKEVRRVLSPLKFRYLNPKLNPCQKKDIVREGVDAVRALPPGAFVKYGDSSGEWTYERVRLHYRNTIKSKKCEEEESSSPPPVVTDPDPLPFRKRLEVRQVRPFVPETAPVETVQDGFEEECRKKVVAPPSYVTGIAGREFDEYNEQPVDEREMMFDRGVVKMKGVRIPAFGGAHAVFTMGGVSVVPW